MVFYMHNDPDEQFSAEIRSNSTERWVWELHDDSGIRAVSTRSYLSRKMCEEAINSIIEEVPSAIIQLRHD